MAHILIDKNNLCTCDQASKCAITHKSGCMTRCTKEQLLENGHQVIEITKSKFWKKIKLIFSKTPYNINL